MEGKWGFALSVWSTVKWMLGLGLGLQQDTLIEITSSVCIVYGKYSKVSVANSQRIKFKLKTRGYFMIRVSCSDSCSSPSLTCLKFQKQKRKKEIITNITN